MDNLKKSGYDYRFVRKCASIISKKGGKIEIIDLYSFKTLEVEADRDIFEQAEINDPVTYIQFGKSAKIVELRK